MSAATMTEHERCMRRCLELAALGEGRVSPNPAVGCLIVREDVVLAEGWHRGPGTPHAEADALAKLEGHAPGATKTIGHERARRVRVSGPAGGAGGRAVVRFGIGKRAACPGGGYRRSMTSMVGKTSCPSCPGMLPILRR